MARYELGVLTTATASGTSAAEIRAASTDPVYIEEIGLFLTAATASTLGLGRPANGVGAGGTVTPWQQTIQDDPAPAGGIILSGQTTAPTAPTQFFRRALVPAAIGNGIIWTFGGEGLRVKQGTSVVIWNLAANSALNAYIVCRE